MSGPELAVYAVSALAAGLGVALAIRERRHLPVACLLVLGFLADVIQRSVRPLYVGAQRPFHGAARAWAHVGQAAFTVYPWAVLVVALLVLAARRRTALGVALAWVGFEALLVLGYRALDLRKLRLGLVYLGAEATLVVGLVAVAVPWWASWRRGKTEMTGTRAILLAAVGAEVIVLFGPMISGRPWLHWTREARPPYFLTNLLAIIIQGVELWISGRSRRG